MFYHAKHLQARGDNDALPNHHPLEFRAVMGDDERLGNSYVNSFEVNETTILIVTNIHYAIWHIIRIFSSPSLVLVRIMFTKERKHFSLKNRDDNILGR